jgi:hypothetical protein
MWKTITITGLLFDILLFFGILKMLFNIEISSNLFNTGLTPGIILGIVNSVLLYGVWKGNI